MVFDCSFPNSVPLAIEAGSGISIYFEKLLVSKSLSSRVIWRYLLSKCVRSKNDSLTLWIQSKGKRHLLEK